MAAYGTHAHLPSIIRLTSLFAYLELDVTPLKHRGIFISLMDLSSLINIWVGQACVCFALSAEIECFLGFSIMILVGI